MRKISVLIFLLFIFCSSKAQWSELHKAPIGTNEIMYHTHWLDSSFFAAHSSSSILFSSDGININRSVQFDAYIYGFQMLTKNRGILIASNNNEIPVMSTDNCGVSWDTLSIIDGSDTLRNDAQKYFMHFSDSLHGFIFSDSIDGFCNTWVTHDGAHTWHKVKTENAPSRSFHEAQFGKAVGELKVWDFTDVSIVGGSKPKHIIYKAYNHFEKWVEVEVPESFPYVCGLACVDTSIWLGNVSYVQDSTLIITKNGGKTWDSIFYPGRFLPTIYFVREDGYSPSFLIAGTNNGSYISRDTGKIWVKQDSFFHRDFSFFNPRVGLSTFFRSSDSGTYRLFEGPKGMTSLRRNEFVDLKIYPNPSKSSFFVDCNDIIQSLIVIDLSGKEILNIKDPGKQSVKIEYPLESGVYIVRITNTEGATGSRYIQIE